MMESAHKILLVESDPDTIEVVVASLAQRFDAQVTCVADAETCLDTDMLEPHDLVICEMDLPDSTGLELAEKLQSLRVRPIILMAHDPDVGDAVEAMRLGVRDLFVRPFAVRALTDSVDRALRGFHVRRRHAQKYRRMRDLIRRMIRERRHLNQRVDLICRDLVGAQRRLVHKFVSAEKSQS